MNRSDVVRMTANKGGVTVLQAEKVVSAFLESVALAVVCGEEVVLRGFGKFIPRTRKAVKRRNPSTGEMMTVPPTRTVAFLPSIPLRVRLNGRSRS